MSQQTPGAHFTGKVLFTSIQHCEILSCSLTNSVLHVLHMSFFFKLSFSQQVFVTCFQIRAFFFFFPCHGQVTTHQLKFFNNPLIIWAQMEWQWMCHTLRLVKRHTAHLPHRQEPSKALRHILVSTRTVCKQTFCLLLLYKIVGAAQSESNRHFWKFAERLKCWLFLSCIFMLTFQLYFFSSKTRDRTNSQEHTVSY